MKFYSGFSLNNESYLFEEYIHNSDYTVCGFSYGSIKALTEVLERLESGKRVDTLQLFSPAFFQSKPVKFKRLQKLAYSKNKELYLREFLSSCFSPYEKKITEQTKTDISELEELLSYEWDVESLEEIAKKGVKIEVYLGGEDKVIDIEPAKDFFIKVATVTYIKSANHFLQTK